MLSNQKRVQRRIAAGAGALALALGACLTAEPADLQFAMVAEDAAQAALEMRWDPAQGDPVTLHLEAPETFRVRDAKVGDDGQGGPALYFELEGPDALRFEEWTTVHKGRTIVVIVDERVLTLTRIMSPLPGWGLIEGRQSGLSSAQLERLADRLEAPR